MATMHAHLAQESVSLFEARFIQLQGEASIQDASNFLYAAALLHCCNPELIFSDELLTNIAARVVQNPLTQSVELHQTLLASRWFNIEFPDEVLQALRRNRRPDRGSELERDVLAALDNPEAIQGHWIEALEVPVDIFIPTQNLIIQVDGPSHFFRDRQLHASDILNSQLLERMGYRVKRIPYFDWDALLSPENKSEYIDTNKLR